MASAELAFAHQFVPAVAGERRTLLLLHGTGGDEHDLLPLGRTLAPGAALLSPRGQVLERGMPRFFRRLAEGVFDQEDLRRRTDELADFVRSAADAYDLDASRIVAVGFSNGANIAASVLLRRPGTLAGAVLIRAMVPFTPETPLSIGAVPVLILAGRADPIVPAELADGLAALLGASGARVTLAWQPGGHQLTPADVAAAAGWLGALDEPVSPGGTPM